jgi:hypothetical protein
MFRGAGALANPDFSWLGTSSAELELHAPVEELFPAQASALVANRQLSDAEAALVAKCLRKAGGGPVVQSGQPGGEETTSSTVQKAPDCRAPASADMAVVQSAGRLLPPSKGKQSNNRALKHTVCKKPAAVVDDTVVQLARELLPPTQGHSQQSNNSAAKHIVCKRPAARTAARAVRPSGKKRPAAGGHYD